MMTDRALATALDALDTMERDARSHLHATADADEHAAAQTAVRQVTALRKPLERWMAARARRAQLSR